MAKTKPAHKHSATKEKPVASARRSRSSGRLNMGDIAREVGVSAITVSRALRTPHKVSPATRQKVQQAVDALGYVPDRVASSLASKRSDVVALILPTITQPLFADTVQGLGDVLAPAGVQMLVAQTAYSEVVEASLVAALLSRRPDGLILVGGEHTDATRTLLQNAAIPVVEIWDLPTEPLDSVVGFSNHAAMFAMTQTLVDSGRQHIGFLGRGQNHRSQLRLDGYRACLATSGKHEAIVSYPTHGEQRDDPVAAFQELIARYPKLDALVCSDDITALQVVSACQRNGWDVPGRMAVTGFCDLPMAAAAFPSLTTVRVPAEQIGRLAGQAIMDRQAGRVENAITEDLGFEIIQRETT